MSTNYRRRWCTRYWQIVRFAVIAIVCAPGWRNGYQLRCCGMMQSAMMTLMTNTASSWWSTSFDAVRYGQTVYTVTHLSYDIQTFMGSHSHIFGACSQAMILLANHAGPFSALIIKNRVAFALVNFNCRRKTVTTYSRSRWCWWWWQWVCRWKISSLTIPVRKHFSLAKRF